jgi:ATP-binding cassette subfamily B protein
VRGEVALEGVHFAYPTRPDAPVLRGLDLRIPAGRTVALVGPSGSGKTTVAALVQRFYEVTPGQGRVTVDGRDVRDADIHWLRQHMAVVPQQPALFAASVAENLRYANPEASDAQLEAAARQAACDFLFDPDVMPHGLRTHIGEAGVSLSGGQRQRLAIARALLRDPAVLILDEATSALDAASEAQVQRAIRAAAKGRTTIVIAHRLSTVRAADTIACLDAGHVAEVGTHEQLLRANGLYAQLVKHQLAE